jgi:hypothetical protein
MSTSFMEEDEYPPLAGLVGCDNPQALLDQAIEFLQHVIPDR